MKILFTLMALTSLPSFAATKATFSIFGERFPFAEATCTGIPGFPQGTTLRLTAMDESGQNFEGYVEMGMDYYLVIDASKTENAPTFFLALTKIDTTPITASTYGLDLGIRMNSALSAHCELNSGTQITQDPHAKPSKSSKH